MLMADNSHRQRSVDLRVEASARNPALLASRSAQVLRPVRAQRPAAAQARKAALRQASAVRAKGGGEKTGGGNIGVGENMDVIGYTYTSTKTGGGDIEVGETTRTLFAPPFCNLYKREIVKYIYIHIYIY